MANRCRRREKQAALLLASLLVPASMVLGQGERGAITGSVMDPSGAAVPDCQITVSDIATNRKYSAASTSAADMLEVG